MLCPDQLSRYRHVIEVEKKQQLLKAIFGLVVGFGGAIGITWVLDFRGLVPPVPVP